MFQLASILKGVGLIEVLLAVFLLSFGMLTTISIQTKAIKHLRDVVVYSHQNDVTVN